MFLILEIILPFILYFFFSYENICLINVNILPLLIPLVSNFNPEVSSQFLIKQIIKNIPLLCLSILTDSILDQYIFFIFLSNSYLNNFSKYIHYFLYLSIKQFSLLYFIILGLYFLPDNLINLIIFIMLNNYDLQFISLIIPLLKQKIKNNIITPQGLIPFIMFNCLKNVKLIYLKDLESLFKILISIFLFYKKIPLIKNLEQIILDLCFLGFIINNPIIYFINILIINLYYILLIKQYFKKKVKI